MIVKNQIENGVIEVSQLIENPANPRSISTKKLNQLKVSIMDFEDMLQISPIVINKDNVVLGGNMRLRALRELSIPKTPFVRVGGLTPEQEKEFIIKDNLTYGDWDWNLLLEEMDVYDLDYMGMDVPSHLFDNDTEREQDLNTIDKQFDSWVNQDEKSIKLFFLPEQQVEMLDKLNQLIEVKKVETISNVVQVLCEQYYTKHNLITDRR